MTMRDVLGTLAARHGQQELAAMLELRQSMISMMLRGDRAISVRTARRIADRWPEHAETVTAYLLGRDELVPAGR